MLPTSPVQVSILKFFISLSVFTVALGLFSFLILHFLQGVIITVVKLNFIFITLFSVTLLVHYLLLRAMSGKPQAFIRNFGMTTLIKLLFYFVFVVISTLTDPANAISFIITFFILYLAYTSFEVTYLIRQTGVGKKKEKRLE